MPLPTHHFPTLPLRLARRLSAAALLLLALALSLSAVPGSPGTARAATTASATASATTKPNIVFILTDDQRFDSLWAMPNVRDRIGAHGVTFSNAFVVNAWCCPSRASILKGQYSHSTGVYTNARPHGGYYLFKDSSTVATWLDGVGYRTALVGKYLNDFDKAGKAGYVPPGWDHFAAFAAANGRYYNYYLNIDRTLEWHGELASDYSTDVLAADAVSFIKSTPASDPLFLYFNPFAPHKNWGPGGPAIPAPRHSRAFANIAPARPPNYDEADMSDKTAYYRALEPLPDWKKAMIDRYRREAYESLLAVDEAVGQIVDTLAQTGRLDNTMIVFTSDNGMLYGEHRWQGKQTHFEEAIRVPLVLRYDPMLAGPRTDGHLVLNIDLAPTFAALAGVASPGAEGRSLLPLLSSPTAAWRWDFLVEHIAEREPRDPPAYCALRNGRYKYVQHVTGEEELYDLRSDPYELQNRASDPALNDKLTRFRSRLRVLCNPPPPGFAFSH